MHFFSISKNFSPHTEEMDFTDFVEPWSFEFIHFHTFFVFVLDNCFLQISQRHEASVEFKFHLEHYRNFFLKRFVVKRHEKDNHFLHFITKFAPKW